jgi:FtsP/CotA-like multicopper oxidase with cupredoxin domain
VIVHFTNEMDEETVIHWHGLRISDVMDGSPAIQSPIPPGGTFTYDFVVPDAGTFWYHTHLHQIKHFEYGLYGGLVVHEADFPVFSAERIFLGDDIRLTSANQVSAFKTSGPDIGAGRIGNTVLVNGKVVSGAAGEPLTFTIPRGAVERWRFVLATNALAYGLRVKGAATRVIATDGGLLPEPFALDRVEIAPGQRYDFEIRPEADASEVVLEALIRVLDENNNVVEEPFPLARGAVEGEISAPDPVYPVVVHPRTDFRPAETLEWAISGGVVNNKVQFTINGEPGFVGDEHEHLLLHTFQPKMPVWITLSSNVSPSHPFHIHGQFFQIVARNGQPVFEPGLRDTVHVRGDETATILSYFENPGRWMVHCHISEHSENGMMAEIQVNAPSSPHGH